MRMYDIILKKRANVPLTDEEIRFVIDGYVKGDIPDYQVSALLMTIVFNGMSTRELGTLTLAMAQSGHMVDLSSIEGITVDKHSTGGVGDKTTLIIGPLVAACGGKMAKNVWPWFRAYGWHYRQDGVHSKLKSIFRTR